jgi:hypothetical protein
MTDAVVGKKGIVFSCRKPEIIQKLNVRVRDSVYGYASVQQIIKSFFTDTKFFAESGEDELLEWSRMEVIGFAEFTPQIHRPLVLSSSQPQGVYYDLFCKPHPEESCGMVVRAHLKDPYPIDKWRFWAAVTRFNNQFIYPTSSDGVKIPKVKAHQIPPAGRSGRHEPTIMRRAVHSMQH